MNASHRVNGPLFCQARGTANRLYAAAKARYSADCRRDVSPIADVSPIPKSPLSALVCNYRPIAITPVLSKVFERLIALRFGRFMERSGLLPSHQYSYRKRLGTCDALLDIVCAGQLELDRGGELALIQIDFSAAFDRVNQGGLVFYTQGESV